MLWARLKNGKCRLGKNFGSNKSTPVLFKSGIYSIGIFSRNNKLQRRKQTNTSLSNETANKCKHTYTHE